jgi:DNA-binding IclR family transcriptional regulator
MVDRSIKSAERTIALFELFSAAETPLTVSEIATALEIPQSSASVLTHKLESLGYLDLNRATRRFKPTIRILLLSSWMTRRFGDSSEIACALDALQTATGEVVILSLQHNARMQTILTRGEDRSGLQYHPPTQQVGRAIMIRSGLFASLTCSAMGRVILSLKPDAEVRAWVRRANAETDDPAMRVTELEMLEALAEVRRSGHAETAGSQSEGLGAFAIALPSPIDTTPLAVSVSLPIARMRRRRDLILENLERLRAQFAAPADLDPEWLGV